MDKVIHLAVDLHCDVHYAFELFTVNILLEQWLTIVADVEPTLGGKYELFWQPDDRAHNSTIGCNITAISANQMIAFEWRSSQQYEHFANTADPLTHVVICFIPTGDTTHVHLVHSGWRSSTEWEEARQWQKRAWTGAFQTLKQIANTSDAQGSR